MSTSDKVKQEFEQFVTNASKHAKSPTDKKTMTVLQAILTAVKQGKAHVSYNPRWDGISPDRFIFEDARGEHGVVV